MRQARDPTPSSPFKAHDCPLTLGFVLRSAVSSSLAGEGNAPDTARTVIAYVECAISANRYANWPSPNLPSLVTKPVRKSS